jgi:hypothetical protein
MSGLKGIAQGGWHPKGKDGKSKESWRGDFKGVNQVAGWMRKGKDPNTEAHEHISRPISTLKDPAAFGPPPKNVNYHGGAALPNQITPDTRGLGAPLSREEIQAEQRAKKEEAQREAEEAAKPKPPPIPYRANTTGLTTSHLPPPPGRKDGADGRTPPPADKPKPPRLPPRLPTRQNPKPALSPPPTYNSSNSEPESYKGILNQGALSRLGAAGVSVQGLGIGGSKGRQPLPPPAPTSSSRTPSNDPPPAKNSQLNDLQSRFSRLSSLPKPENPSEGTSFAQKQAALKTASSFRNDPLSVSLSDARTAASTANNFRERHGEQVKSGWQSANKLNSKYGIADKVGAYSGVGNSEHEAASPQDGTNQNALPEVAASKKKPPPPPPAKKPQLASSTVGKEPLAPPIPMSSKPKPQVSRPYHSVLHLLWRNRLFVWLFFA